MRLLILFLLSATLLFGQNVQLPDVTVSGTRDFSHSTNKSSSLTVFSNFPILSADEDDKTIIIQKKSKLIQSKINKKNAFFSFGYGLYDNLKTDLIFGNALPTLFYFVSFHRYSIDYFYNNQKKIFNSSQYNDNFEINLGSDKNKTYSWLSSVTYYKQIYGLQTNRIFSDGNEKNLQINNSLSWKLNEVDTLSAGINYTWSSYAISGIHTNFLNTYQQIRGNLKFNKQWSENNNLILTLDYSYKTLFKPNIREQHQISLMGYDNFLLFNLLNMKIYVDTLYSQPHFFFLPYIDMTSRLNETVQLKIFGGLQKKLNTIPTSLQDKNYLSGFTNLLTPTLSSLGGIGIDSIIKQAFIFSADLSFKSDKNYLHLSQNPDNLFSLNSTDIDYWILHAKINLLKTLFTKTFIDYKYRLFSRVIPYVPEHTLTSGFYMKFPYISMELNLQYWLSFPKDVGYLHDIFTNDFFIKGKITKNIFWNLNFHNLFNQFYSYYEGYREPGFLVNLGLKINLL